jgi:predicted dehydrogenase
MVDRCEHHDVQLTFNHQLRYGAPVRKAKSLLDGGTVGELERVAFSADNLYDAGTHLFDLCGLLTEQRPVEWVLGQLDYREENVWFGEHNANQAIAQWRYEDGVYGLASVGEGSDFLDARLRLTCTDGTIAIGGPGGALRVRRGGQWERVDTHGEGIYGPQKTRARAALASFADAIPGVSGDGIRTPSLTDRAIAAVIDALETDRTPELGAENALQATELIFAAWESARRRGRVELPLQIQDNPLEAMVRDGALLTE